MKDQQKPKSSKDEIASIARKLAALETKVRRLERRNRDLALKSQIASTFMFRSPLEEFFASPEFWENTYDSGQADCSKRCIEALQASYKACDAQYEAASEQWNACRAEALERAANCHKNCSGAFPPPIG